MMQPDSKQILDTIIKVISPIIDDESKIISSETSIAELDMDSFKFVEMLVGIEGELDINFNDLDLVMENYCIIEDLINKIKLIMQHA